MSAPEVSLRQKHIERTHQQIVDVALGLFSRQGFDDTTVDEIAAGAEVSPRTFFRYFPTKEAVLFAGLDERLSEMRRLIAERPAAEGPFDALVAALRTISDEMVGSPDRFRLLQRLIRDHPQLRIYQRNTLLEIAEREMLAALAPRAGVAVDDVGLRAIVAATIACFDVSLRAWIEHGAASPFQPLFTQALTACSTAFRADPKSGGGRR